MKRLIYILLFSLISFTALAQDPVPASPTLISPNFSWYRKITGSDTTYFGFSAGSWTQFARNSWVKKYFVLKSDSNINGSYITPSYFRSHTPILVYTSDYINRTSTRIGSLNTGDTLHSAGKTPEQVTQIIFTQTIHPTYNIPSSSVSGSPSPGVYLIGTQFDGAGGVGHQPQIVLSSGFTQNQGGTVTGTTYKQGASTVASTVPSFTLTSPVSFTVQKTYNAGVCIANNLGVTDCIVGAGNAPNPAPVASGTAISSAITYTQSPAFYFGYASSTTPTNTELKTHAGGGEVISNSHGSTANGFPSGYVITPSGPQYLYFAYDAAQSDIVSIFIGGLDSTSNFTKTTISFTNEAGYTQSFKVCTSISATSGVVTAVVN